MNKFIDKNITIILLTLIGYFLFSISNSLRESSKYNADLRACARMKAYLNNKDLSKLFEQEASAITGVSVEFISEYCKKLTQHNLF